MAAHKHKKWNFARGGVKIGSVGADEIFIFLVNKIQFFCTQISPVLWYSINNYAGGACRKYMYLRV